MRAWRLPALGLAALILISILGFLYYQTQMFDLERQSQVLLDLRILKQMDVEWSANILRSRIGMNHDYDPLSLSVHPMQVLQERLHQALELTRLKAASISLTRFSAAFTEKRELVERFKSQNAILRNSLIYFPIAVEELKQQLREVEKTKPGQALEMTSLEAQISTLMADTLRFNLVPDAQLASQIKAQLAQLEGRAWHPRIHAMLVQLSAHIHVIVRQRVLEDVLLARLSVIASDRIIDDILHSFEQEFARALAEKQRYRRFLLDYVAFLALLVPYVGWWITKRYRMNLQKNQHLQATNDTLARHMAERNAQWERQASQLAEMVAYDSLTGLANGAQLIRQLERALLRAERCISRVALLYIGLDGLQVVRDTYGQSVGDVVLQEVAHRVPRNFREEDCFARLKSDEFVILLEDVATLDGVLRVAQEVLWQIEQISSVAGCAVKLSAWFGISCAHGRSGVASSATALLDEADRAMSQVKQGAQGVRIALSENAKWDADGSAK